MGGRYNSKIKRERTNLKYDLYFMRSYDEGLREQPRPAARASIFKAAV